jgi:hypothetical protein
MRYYLLRDDVEMAGRWILADPVIDQGCDPFDFTRGMAVHVPEPVVEVQGPGLPLAFSMTTLDVPIATTALAECVAAVAGRDVQRIPVRLGNRAGHEILNCLRVIDALDESRSEFMKWTAGDGRPDKVGQYRMVTRLRIDPHKLPADAQLFRLQGWVIALVVSESVKQAMEYVGCFGARFQDVT